MSINLKGSGELCEAKKANLASLLISTFRFIAPYNKKALFVKGLSENFPVFKKLSIFLNSFENHITIDDILVYYDSTLFGGGDEGFVLLKDRIICNTQGSDINEDFLFIKNIEKIWSGFKLFLDHCDRPIIDVSCAEEIIRDAIVYFIAELQTNNDKYIVSSIDSFHAREEEKLEPLTKDIFKRFHKAWEGALSALKKCQCDDQSISVLRNESSWATQKALSYVEAFKITLPADIAQFLKKEFSDGEMQKIAWEFLSFDIFTDDEAIKKYSHDVVFRRPFRFPSGVIMGDGIRFPKGYGEWCACYEVLAEVFNTLGQYEELFKFERDILKALMSFLDHDPPRIIVGGWSEFIMNNEHKFLFWPHR